MSAQGPDVNRIQNTIVTIFIVGSIIMFGLILLAAENQKNEPPTEYGCIYDPRDGSKHGCQYAP